MARPDTKNCIFRNKNIEPRQDRVSEFTVFFLLLLLLFVCFFSTSFSVPFRPLYMCRKRNNASAGDYVSVNSTSAHPLGHSHFLKKVRQIPRGRDEYLGKCPVGGPENEGECPTPGLSGHCAYSLLTWFMWRTLKVATTQTNRKNKKARTFRVAFY